MLSTVSDSTLIAYGTIASVFVAVGGGLGSRIERSRKRRKNELEMVETLRATLQELTWAVGGKPADEFNPERRVGIIEQINISTEHQRQFEGETERMFEKLLERAERSESSIKEATAVAAKAVLDTAGRLAADKTEAEAIASAKIIATAVAAELVKSAPKTPRARRVAVIK